MKAASISELKNELVHESPARLVELCLRLARFKKENKELLTYLLFQAHDINTYIAGVKEEISDQFQSMNASNVYFIKKTLRKILRIAGKYIRYSNSEIVEAELLIHFCTLVKTLGEHVTRNPVISNIFLNQLKKIHKAIDAMHEDLQYDYQKQVKEISA